MRTSSDRHPFVSSETSLVRSNAATIFYRSQGAGHFSAVCGSGHSAGLDSDRGDGLLDLLGGKGHAEWELCGYEDAGHGFEEEL